MTGQKKEEEREDEKKGEAKAENVTGRIKYKVGKKRRKKRGEREDNPPSTHEGVRKRKDKRRGNSYQEFYNKYKIVECEDDVN